MATNNVTTAISPPPRAARVILTLDIGGTNAKSKCPHWESKLDTPSGPDYTPQQLAKDMALLTGGEKIDAITIGLPAPIKDGRPLRDPVNLGPGWTDFDYRAAFGVPVKILNDAAMQAIGSYHAANMTSGTMLFLGLGTGLGSCMIANHQVLPMELAHLPFRKGKSFEEFLGIRGKERRGTRRWRGAVAETVKIFSATLLPDVIVLGGGNSKALKEIPAGCMLGANSNAFLGGFAVWEREWSGAATEI